MNKRMAGILLAYGFLLGVFGIVFQRIAPGDTNVTLIASLVGGGLCTFLGVRALGSGKGRGWAVLTMIAITFVMLGRAVPAWLVFGEEEVISRGGRLLLTLMLLMTLGTVTYVVHGERPPEDYVRGGVGPARRGSQQKEAPSERSINTE